MRQLLILVERDVRNAPWRRLALGGALILAFQVFTALASKASRTHIEWAAVFFFLWLFGFLAAIGLSFDRMSSERESRSLDLLLTSGVARPQVVASKVIVALLLAAALGTAFLAATTMAYAPLAGASALSVWRYLIPVCALFAVYALLGLVCSVAFRTSKASLLVAFSIALAGRPRLYEALVERASRLLGLGPRATAALDSLCPEMALIHVTGVGPIAVERQPALAWLALVSLTVVATVLAFVIFARQDEPAYGD